MREEIAQALEEVRPHLQVDGGDVELVEVEDGVVKVLNLEDVASNAEQSSAAAILAALG